MNIKTTISLVAALLLAGHLPAADKPTPETGAAQLRAFSDAFADVAARVRPSVVTIFSEKTVKVPRFQMPFGNGSPFDFFFDDGNAPRQRRNPRQSEYKQTGMGSGMLVDKEGHILTNNHVVDDTDEIKVKFADGTTLDAEVVGNDPRSDLAVLKLKGKLPTGITPAVLGDSDATRVAEWVLAIGAPFGFEQTVTAGIISAKARSQIDGNRDKYEDYLQTDAAINRGNSGGPLLNMRGEVIGINTAIISESGANAGVGFAIPINMAKRVMRDLLQTGHVTRGYLGVVIQDLTPELAEQFKIEKSKGAIVAQVAQDTPAGKAGVTAGDVIVQFNKQPVEDTRQLRNLVAETAPNTKAELLVIRDGKERPLIVTIGELPDATGAPARRGDTGKDTDNLGLTVEPLTPRQARAMGYANVDGVLVSAVDNNSPAADAGLRPGDLITEVNRQPVANIEEFRAALDKSPGKALLLVKNREASRFVVLPTK